MRPLKTMFYMLRMMCVRLVVITNDACSGASNRKKKGYIAVAIRRQSENASELVNKQERG